MAADPAEQTLTDDLNDWSKTYAHTAGLSLDATNSIYFGGDTSRAKRTTGTTESIVYHIPQVTNFKATLYHFNLWDGVALYASPDNANWTKVVHVSTPGVYTGSEWYRKVYSPQALRRGQKCHIKLYNCNIGRDACFSHNGIKRRRLHADYIP